MSFRDLIRRIIPVRASIFAAYREEQKKVMLAQTEEIGILRNSIDELRWELIARIDQLDSAEEKRVSAGTAEVKREIRAVSSQAEIAAATRHKTMVAKVDSANRLALDALPEELRISGIEEWPRYNEATRPEDVRRTPGANVIVSLTSYPARIAGVEKTIQTLLDQSVSADWIELWLAEDQFPLCEEELPRDLLELRNQGLRIRWCDDLKAHKKYYYAILENPDSVVITVDDDVEYSFDTIEILMRAHSLYPDCVCARRARKIIYGADGKVASYSEWPLSHEVGMPRDDLLATGVGGVLYPPHCMDERLFEKSLLQRICPQSDDLWLGTMQRIKGTKLVLADDDFVERSTLGSQEVALYRIDRLTGRNDEDIRKIKNAFKIEFPGLWSAPASHDLSN